jgi:hypothetical protein
LDNASEEIMDFATDPFLNIDTTEVSTSAGPCTMPIRYYDASLIAAVYRVSAAAAREAVVDPEVEPLLVAGKAAVLVCGFEYRGSTIGPYNEVGVAVLAKRAGSRPSLLKTLWDQRAVTDVGLSVVALPVTTPEACAAGRELWGYPKYVTPITTAFSDEAVELGIPGEFTMTVGKPGRLTMAGLPFITLSTSGGSLLRTIIEVDHRTQLGGAVELSLTGSGPTADALRTLGVDKASPSVVFRTNGMRSVLPLGTPIASSAAGEAASAG